MIFFVIKCEILRTYDTFINKVKKLRYFCIDTEKNVRFSFFFSFKHIYRKSQLLLEFSHY